MRFTSIALLFCSISAQAASNIDAHFAYRITGDRIAAPVQVFDNKGRTYLQLRDMNAPPAIFSEDGRPLTYSIESPYLILGDVYPGLILRYGKNNEAKIKNADYVARIIPAVASASTPISSTTLAEAKVNGSSSFGSAKSEKETGRAAAPITVKTPEQKATERKVQFTYVPGSLEKENKVAQPITTGKFLLGNDVEKDAIATGKFTQSTGKKIESESDSVEFTVQGGKLYPAQTVRLSALVGKIGKDGTYVVSNGKSSVGEANGMCVKSRLIALGVSVERIKVENKQPVDNDYMVVITGEKK